MTHDQVLHPHEQISALVDGELDGVDMPAVEAHLARCGECRALAADLRVLGAAIASEDVPAIPDSLAPRIGWSIRNVPAAPPSAAVGVRGAGTSSRHRWSVLRASLTAGGLAAASLFLFLVVREYPGGNARLTAVDENSAERPPAMARSDAPNRAGEALEKNSDAPYRDGGAIENDDPLQTVAEERALLSSGLDDSASKKKTALAPSPEISRAPRAAAIEEDRRAAGAAPRAREELKQLGYSDAATIARDRSAADRSRASGKPAPPAGAGAASSSATGIGPALPSAMPSPSSKEAAETQSGGVQPATPPPAIDGERSRVLQQKSAARRAPQPSAAPEGAPALEFSPAPPREEPSKPANAAPEKGKRGLQDTRGAHKEDKKSEGNEQEEALLEAAGEADRRKNAEEGGLARSADADSAGAAPPPCVNAFEPIPGPIVVIAVNLEATVKDLRETVASLGGSVRRAPETGMDWRVEVPPARYAEVVAWLRAHRRAKLARPAPPPPGADCVFMDIRFEPPDKR